MIYLNRPCLGFEELESVKEVLDSKWLVEGLKTLSFENELKKILKCRFVISTSNATSSLICALNCFKNKHNIIIPSFTHPASIIAVQNSSLNPVFVDVDLDTMQMHRRLIVDDTHWFYLPVSLFGRPLDPDIYRLKGVIIEDAANSLGTHELKASLACFSFQPRKIITTGEGGIVATNNENFSKQIIKHKKFGKNNYQFNDILAAIGLCQLKKLPGLIKKRRFRALIYSELLSKLGNIVPPLPIKNHTYQSFVCLVKEGLRNKMIKELKRNKIEAQVGSYALHLLPRFTKIKRLGELKNSEYLAKNTITLPIHHELTKQNVELICKIVGRVN